jgi:ribonuclease R
MKHSRNNPNKKSHSPRHAHSAHTSPHAHHHSRQPATPSGVGAASEGIVRTTPKGIGFIPHPTKEKEDIRIEEGNLNTALHGDKVLFELLNARARDQQTGRVLKVIHRAKTKFVGTVAEGDGGLVVIPDDRKSYIKILLKDSSTTQIGDKIFVELLPWSDSKKLPEGRLIENIGRKGLHEVEIRSIILEKGIDDTFPKEVEADAQRIFERAQTDTDVSGRKDFRTTPTCTIDPVDAKDFDDALSVRFADDDTIEVGIHIADVSHFVTPGSALDREAQKRGFSSYLVDRTIPMLPEVLSNDLCSLKPDVDRLTYSAWFTLSKEGVVLSRNFGRGIIHSQKRFTYEEAQQTLSAGSGMLYKELSALNTIAKQWRQERMKRGAIDFEQHEVRFELADDGVPLSAYLKERLDTHKLIEEFMLLANREVAEFIYTKYEKKRHPFIYRVHDQPNPERIRDLADFAKALGHTLEISNKGTVTGKALNKLFTDVADTPEEDLINTAGLRSMAKAIYSTKNIGHFGLSLPAYTQFTSPIRRYADVLVHRLLNEELTKGTLPLNDYPFYAKLAEQISERELSIIDAERESVKLKQAEYMAARIGKEFEGVISGVSDFGLFVEERDTHADGLIRMTNLPNDYYRHEPKKYRVIGEKTKKIYSLGDVVKFRVLSVDVDRKQIDCALVDRG